MASSTRIQNLNESKSSFFRIPRAKKEKNFMSSEDRVCNTKPNQHNLADAGRWILIQKNVLCIQSFTSEQFFAENFPFKYVYRKSSFSSWPPKVFRFSWNVTIISKELESIMRFDAKSYPINLSFSLAFSYACNFISMKCEKYCHHYQTNFWNSSSQVQNIILCTDMSSQWQGGESESVSVFGLCYYDGAELSWWYGDYKCLNFLQLKY